MKLCIDCKFLHNLEPSSYRANCWYNHICLKESITRSTYNGMVDALEQMHYDLSQLIITVEKNDGDATPFKLARREVMVGIKKTKAEYYAQ